MHESIRLIEKPTTSRICIFLEWFEKDVRLSTNFDILDHPEASHWLSVTDYFPDEAGQYDLSKTVSTFAGSKLAQEMEIENSRLEDHQVDDDSRNRWGPVQWKAARTRQPVFVKTHIYGIGKDFIDYEAGVFPFVNDTGLVTKVVMVIALLKG